MSESKKAKFFCENCGSEVASKARFCPKCGKFFAAVRCPNCGHTGNVRDFKKGCPKCHYAMSKNDLFGTNYGNDSSSHDENLNSGHKKNSNRIFSVFNKLKNTAGESFDDSPKWVLFSGLAVLAACFVVLIMRCNK